MEVVAVPGRRRRRECRRGAGCAPTRWCSPPRTSGRPAACSPPRRGRRCSAGRSAPGRWSSRTTTTPSTATTAPPVGAMQGLDPERVATPAPPARRWRPGFASVGSSCRPISSNRSPTAKLLHDRGSPILDQLTFADFLGPRRVRPPPASHAAHLPLAPRRAADRAEPGTSPSSSRPGSRPACTWWPGCPIGLRRGRRHRGGGQRGRGGGRRRSLPLAPVDPRRAHLRLLESLRASDRRRGGAAGPGDRAPRRCDCPDGGT